MIQRLQITLTLAGMVIWSSISWADPSDWIETHSKSVARITFVECTIQDACKNEVGSRKRVATGFLFTTETGQDVVITALHAVIGQGDVFYHFQEAGGAKVKTRIVAANPDADIAFLELRSRPQSARPLEPRFGATVGEQDVYVIGYSYQIGTPIDSKGRSRHLGRKLSALLPAAFKPSIDALGFPDLDTLVIGLDKALAPGDSGAPIFDKDGYVVGIGNGGVPDTGSYISWAMPIAATREAKPWRGRHPLKDGAQVGNALYSASIDRLFYVDELFKNDTQLGNAILYYALRFETSEGRLNDYVREMAKVDDDFLYRRADQNDETFFGGVPMRSTDHTFPGSGAASRHGGLLQDLGSLKIALTCYSRPTFQKILNGEMQERDAQELLKIVYPLGDLRKKIDASDVELSVTKHFETFLNLSSKKPIALETFFPGVRVNTTYDRRNPQELLGGLCRVEFDDRPGISSPYERALAQGVVLIRLRLSELLAFDLFPPAVLPAAGNLNRLELWATLPPRPIMVSDDVNSIFKWR